MTQKQVIEVMKTGNFTIAYHDNSDAHFYKGKFSYDRLPDEADYTFGSNYAGYMSEEVYCLIQALKGKGDSI